MLWKHLLVILHCTTLHHVRKHTTRSCNLSSKIKDKFDGERLGREKFHGAKPIKIIKAESSLTEIGVI